ncbi:retrovirus-related pol polyprotein from transposon TNT 1-94 [Tanacetum coccineum]
MLTKPQFFYDHTTKQALGFQNPFYLKKAQQLEPKLYVGDIIEKTNPIVIFDSKETLILVEESRSKMHLKQQDSMMLEKKVNTTPIDYNSVNSPEPALSRRPTKVEVPKELPKVSMVNTSLKKLKYHLAGFDVVVKERTTPTAITEGSWGFEHTKACFRDEIIPFVKDLKDLFNTFNQYLVDELSKVQNVFHQIEQAVEQHRLESKTFEVKMNQVLNKNERLLEQVLSKDIVNIIVNSSVNNTSVNVHECEKCLQLETELQTDFIEKEIYDKLVTKLIAENKHLKQTYKQLYDSIKPARIRSKEHSLEDDLRKLKGKSIVDNDITKHLSDPERLKIDVEPITPNLYAKLVQELLTNISNTCPSTNNADGKLVASKTKSWLWHQRLSYLNFGAINHLARHGLVRGLPKLKFEKDHLCSACAMGKSKKKPHKPKSEDTNQEKLYLLHMDLCGPMRVASVNGKKSKDEALDFIIKFLKMIQVWLQVIVRRIRTYNGTEFVNQTLREYYEKIGISHETSVARSP